MIRVTSGSRLHLGVFDPVGRFGGVGLMIDRPHVRVRFEPADDWHADGPEADRVLDFAARYRRVLGDRTIPPRRIVVEECPPAHVGLGSGTQLALCVARGLAAAAEITDFDHIATARQLGRGKRSSIGSHGFAHGGFLVDAGRNGDTLAPLAIRLPFPSRWRIVVVVPAWGRRIHGAEEQAAFDRLRELPRQNVELLERLVFDAIVPALRDACFEHFAAALEEFNRRVGETFRESQGGVYSDPRHHGLADRMREAGLAGIAQSSWGPAMIGLAPDAEIADRASHLLTKDKEEAGPTSFVASARNVGADVAWA